MNLTLRFKGEFHDFLAAALKDGHEVSFVLGGLSTDAAKAFEKEMDLEGAYYFTADNILLKTIVRSNPGIVLWKDGIILDKWHKKQLPSYEKVKETYIKE